MASMKGDSGAQLKVIDAGLMDVVATVRGGLVPVDVEVDAGIGRVYVIDEGAYNIETVDPRAGLVWVVDARSNQLVRTLGVGIAPTDGALSDGSLFLLTHSGTLSRLDLT